VLKQFGIKLLVTGKITKSKESSGFSGVRIYPTKGMATYHVGLKQELWEKGPTATKEFFRQTLRSGFEGVVAKASRTFPCQKDSLKMSNVYWARYRSTDLWPTPNLPGESSAWGNLWDSKIAKNGGR
jgi:hypothetical protein